MYRHTKGVTLLLVTLILMALARPLLLVSQYTNGFQIYGYSYKSSANEPRIYPGSRYVLLVIDVMYSGSEEVYVYSACLDLPHGFSPSRGYSICSSAMLPNATLIRRARPGDIITFRFYLDVSKDVQPGNYNIGVWLTYGYSTTTYDKIHLGDITITVSDYPPLVLEVADNYWSPDAYPGSQNIYLHLVLRNKGSTDIVQGIGVIKLQPNVFTPSIARFSFTNLGVNSFITVTVGPLSVYPEALPGVYYVELSINATLRTLDGILYNDECLLSLSVIVNVAPYVNIKIVDYGFIDVRVSQGSTNARVYVTIVNQDFVTIRSLIASFTIVSGGEIANGSKDSMYILTTPLYYGNSATLYSNTMLIDATANVVTVRLTLVIFADRDGAELWSTQTYTLSISVKKPEVDIAVTEVYWSGGNVYPGSKDATLIVILENRDIINIRDAVAILNLSRVFYPTTVVIPDIDIPSGSRATLMFNPISISPQAIIGTHVATLKITGIAYTQTGSYYTTELELKLVIPIAKPENRSCLEVVSYDWITGKAYTSMVNTGLQVHLRVANPFYTVVNPQITFHLPPGIAFDNNNRSKTIALENRFSYGQIVSVQIQGIVVYIQEPAVYPIVMELEYLAIDSNGNEFWNRETMTLTLCIQRPSLNITLIDFGWLNRVTTGYTSGASLYILFQSSSVDTIKTLTAVINSSTPQIIRGGSSSTTAYIQQPINYGDTVMLTFSNLEFLCSECLRVNISLLVSAVKVIGTAYYRVEEWIQISVPLTLAVNVFDVIAVNVYYGTSPAPPLSTARNIRINIVVANNKPYDIAWIKPIVNNISNIFTRINSVEGSCLGGLARGGVCNLVLDVDISPYAKPEVHIIPIEFLYAIYTRDAIAISKDVIKVPVSIANISYYMPSLRILTWHWGTQVPIRVYPGQRNVPISIMVVNDGVYEVKGVELYLYPRDNNVKIIEGSSLCAVVLAPNSYCTATFYVDIDVNVKGMVVFDVKISYVFTEFGVNINNTNIHTITLKVDEYAAGRGLRVVDYSWIYNWPAYPATDNATYVVRLYNSWPYRVSGIIARLILPEGFRSRDDNVAIVYVQGPIQSFQVVDIAFTVSIDGNVKPGRHSAKLELDYVVESGAPHIRYTEAAEVYLQVHGIENSISLIQTKWVSQVPEPKTYGAVLAVAIRNNYIPSIRGPVLEVYTDNQYILFSDTNTTYGVIPATNIPPESVEVIPQISGVLTRYTSPPRETLEQIMKQLTSGSVSEFSYGSTMYFYLKLNLLVESPKVYSIKAYLNFIDQWNNVRRVPIEIPIHILGSSRILKIDAISPLSIINGEANLTVVIQNIGSAPIYNVYVYLIPQTPLLIPSSNLAYIDAVYPGQPTYPQFKLVYNPTAFFAGMTTQYVRYSSAIFVVAVIFRDATGTTRYLNLSLAVPIEPFIELRTMGTKISITDSYLHISGVVINYGLATARSVEVVVLDVNGVVLGSSFLGDLDPASQYAFRIEAKIGRGSSCCTLRIIYRDEYNRIKSIDNLVSVSHLERIETVTQTILPQDHGLTATHVITVILVALFLAFVGLTIYRYLRKHIRKLEERVEV